MLTASKRLAGVAQFFIRVWAGRLYDLVKTPARGPDIRFTLSTGGYASFWGTIGGSIHPPVDPYEDVLYNAWVYECDMGEKLRISISSVK